MLTLFRHHCSLRFAAALAALVAWLAVSNHCVLGALVKPEATHHCCQDSVPHKQEPQETPTLCCKTVAVTIPDNAKLSFTPVLLPDLAFVFLTLPSLPAPENSSPHFTTGPPLDVPAFTELVLHRSLRAHAPPVVS